MKVDKLFLKNICQIIVLIGLCNLGYTQKKDIWSGNYVLRSSEGAPIDTLMIKNAADLSRMTMPSSQALSPGYWRISSQRDHHKEEIAAIPFLFKIENNENDYEQFGWTVLHVEGKMDCIDAGHLFICKTEKNSQITIQEETFFTTTGIFGIRLHYGLFELKRLNQN
ncbi:MAG: hypothetical protein AAGD88_10695 [Bacteroidota bacterium]